MKRNVIICFLLLLIGCSIAPRNRSNKSVPDNLSESEGNIGKAKSDMTMQGDPGNKMSIKEWDDKLVSEVDRFITRNGFVEMKDARQTKLSSSHPVPVIAITGPELARLRTAWASHGAAHDLLAERFRRADDAIAEGLTFPPQGGQHNQWYQCDSCQRSLRTIDAHHHQCPSCGRIYSGFPYDNVLYNRRHSRNIRNAEDAAWAWAVTGKKKYADFAAEVLSGYAERYLKYPMISASVSDSTIDIAAGKNGKYRSAGHMQSQTLDESNTMIPVVTAYDLIYNYLTPEKRQQIEINFLRAMVESINLNKTGKSNWQTWHNAALLYAGAVMGDGEMIRQALLDDKNGFTAQMKISVLPEGMWYENSWGYHYYTLSAMTHIAEGTRRLGINIYDYPALRNMYLIAFNYLMGDGSLPRFGDAVQDSPVRQDVNEKAYAAYNDDRLLATLSPDITWDAIVLGRDIKKKSSPVQPVSRLIPGAGHAVLATDGPGKLTAAITFGPYGGFHGHFDKLSFVLFGYGQELAVDPGRAASQAYRLPVHREWYKASTGHNVVLVDGNSQKEAEGKCLAFNSTGSFAAVTADAGPAFGNIAHVRFLLLTPEYLMVIDELKSNDCLVHQYDWLYHNKGQQISCSLPVEEEVLEKIPAGYTYLKDITSHRSDKNQPIIVSISGDKANLFMTLAGEDGDQVFTANGPLSGADDRVPVVIARRNGQSVRFAAILEPVASKGIPVVKSLTFTTGDGYSATVIHDRGTDHISFPSEKLDNFIISRETNSGTKVLLKSFLPLTQKTRFIDRQFVKNSLLKTD